MDVDKLLKTNNEMLIRFCKKHNITRLSLFGSTLRGGVTDKSDIDLLVEFDPQHVPGLITLAGIEIELSQMLGKKVDLRTAQDLSAYFRDEVLNEAKEQYAKA